MHPTDNGNSTILALTDCRYFMRGACMYGSNCRYRHCEAVLRQPEICSNWPDSCRNIQCQYRHPVPEIQTPESSVPKTRFISFFWDIENVSIPRGQNPFDIVQRIRQKLIEPGLKEIGFSCFCDVNTISRENQRNLYIANVLMIHIPDRGPDAADRLIMQELDRFERVHQPPATIVLISGDIDFVRKLSDLRHHARFTVIVIHNKPAKKELKATVHADYPWELFTAPSEQQKYHDYTDSKIPVPISRQSRSKSRIINNQKIPMQNGNMPTNPPVILRRPDSANRNSRQIDSSRPRDAQQYSNMNQVPNYNRMIDTPPLPPRSLIAPRPRERKSATHSYRKRQPSTNSSTKNEQNSFICPHCAKQFNTIEALNQHQNDKNHPTQNGHDTSNNNTTDNHDVQD